MHSTLVATEYEENLHIYFSTNTPEIKMHHELIHDQS